MNLKCHIKLNHGFVVKEEGNLFRQTNNHVQQAADQGLIRKMEFSSSASIRSFCRFVAKSKVSIEPILFECYGCYSPAEYFRGNFEGSKPTILDVGKYNGKMEKALEHCRTHLGDNVTINSGRSYLSSTMRKMVEDEVKGGAWEKGRSNEMSVSDQVVVVTTGGLIMEVITKARTQLWIVLAEPRSGAARYLMTKEYLQQASAQGLVEMVELGEEVEVEHGSPVWVRRPANTLVEELEAEVLEGEKKDCLPGCCTS